MTDKVAAYDDNIRFSCRFVTCNIAAACLLHIPDWLSLVERLVWDQEAVSSILASGTAGLSSWIARRVHTPEVVGSSPSPAILCQINSAGRVPFLQIGSRRFTPCI